MSSEEDDRATGSRIGDLLVSAGVVSREELERIVETRKLVGERRILSELFALGVANERQLAEALAQRAGSPVAVLSESVVDLSILKLVPADMLRKYCALPVAADEASVTVVAPDTDSPGLSMPLAFATGRRVVQLVGIHDIVERTIDAALAALAAGERLWFGQCAVAKEPFVAVARFAPAVGLEEANAIARQIVEALTDPPFEAPTSISSSMPSSPSPPLSSAAEKSIGALRLKTMVIDKSGGVIERVREVRDPGLRALHIEDIAVMRGSDDEPMIMVVDDDDAIRTMLTKALEHDGFIVLQAKNGEEAITLLRLMRPHVIILDAMLPMIHGFEICAALKRSQLRDVPVVMISAIYRGWEIAREIQEVHGADAFVEKPFEVTYLRKLVADVLQRPHAPVPKPADIAARVEEARLAYEDHVAHGLFPDADADLSQWLSLDPFDGRAWLERGNLHALHNDLVAAMSAYEAAVIYDPTLLIAQLGLAVIYEQLGFQKRARSTWQKARGLAPDDATRASIDKHLS